ncbi:hypothetical protein OG225_06370 [Nocardia sp. NBC_01377]|uniref:hypothetical protein n=1 Tax=Nocardia sp. NBC_01377 TaxID=2903595 RepID=UPI0032434FC0
MPISTNPTASLGDGQIYDITDARALVITTPVASEPDVVYAVLKGLHAVDDQQSLQSAPHADQ